MKDDPKLTAKPRTIGNNAEMTSACGCVILFLLLLGFILASPWIMLILEKYGKWVFSH